MELLERLGLQSAELVDENKYRYDYDLGSIYFIIFKDKNDKDFFQAHSQVWCENKTEFFVCEFADTEVHICDSKTKPDINNPIEIASIDSFRYEENTPKAEKYMQLFKKENIDTGECLKEIHKFLEERKRERKRKTVDEDLLENLEKCRNNITELLGERDNGKEIAQKLIDRCLFIRFLEDRAGRDNLKNILSDDDPNKRIKKLLRLFDFYNDSLNGDIFEKGDIPENIDVKIMRELYYIFGEIYTYPTSQSTLFPYNFKHIPIILISNIYEKFLAEEKRKSEGIVFTPENIVDYTIEKILEDSNIVDKIKSGQIRILDPTCGSGVFLVKFLEKIITINEYKNAKKLSLEEKADLVKKCVCGIDKNNDALRIAALSLYLKIIEGEKPEVINEKLFTKNDKHFMFPGLKDNKNLVNGNSLFDNILEYEPFDIIVGNPPWGYDFTEMEKKVINWKWPGVSKHQSSQCFLLKMERWIKEGTICGMVVNLSNFTNPYSKKFRSYFTNKYSLKTFVNLSKIKYITFGVGSESACIIIFTKLPSKDIEFFTPDLSQFSKLTSTISDANKVKVSADELGKSDYLWHVYALGYGLHVELIEFLDSKEKRLNMLEEKFETGIMKYSKKKSGLSREEFYKRYKSSYKLSEKHFPILDSLKDIRPYFGKESEEYLLYGPHLDRPRHLDLFKGEKLIIPRRWPIGSFLDSTTRLFDGNFYIFKLRKDCPNEYLSLFESILNSKVARFYLGVKYLLRMDGSYSKVNEHHLKQFPIPNFENKTEIIKEILKALKLIKSNVELDQKLQDELDKLVYKLYELDYYAICQIEHYNKLEKEKRKTYVTDDDVRDYCIEFIDTFKPVIKEGLFINSDWNISDFFGTMVRFTISETRRSKNVDNKELKRFIHFIEKHEIKGYDRKKVFKEEKIKFYDGDKLYIYKSNKPNDWTRLMAIKDASEEVELFFQKMGEI